MTIEEAFGEVIRELRKANQISQEKLAELSNLDRSFISLLECGHKQPSLYSLLTSDITIDTIMSCLSLQFLLMKCEIIRLAFDLLISARYATIISEKPGKQAEVTGYIGHRGTAIRA